MADKKTKVYMTIPDKVSLTKAIRAKCLDCAEGNNGVRDCHICKCPLWPYRFGAGPESAINRLSNHYDVCLVDISKADYVEQTKGQRLKRPDLSKIAQNQLGRDLSDENFEDE